MGGAVGTLIDHEQKVARLDRVAFLEGDTLNVAADAGTYVDRADGRIRPVNTSHWRTDVVTTWAASTSGGGGGEGASAWLLLQAVIVVAMATMATAERLARSDASK